MRRMILVYCLITGGVTMWAQQQGRPQSVAIDAAGNLYFTTDFLLLKQARNGRVQSMVETQDVNSLMGVALDQKGNAYVADRGKSHVLKISPTGAITTFAGNGRCCHDGDGGPAINASLHLLAGLAVDAGGNVFIADCGAHRVRKVSPPGTITRFAGGDAEGYSGDGGSALNASLSCPSDVTVDGAGNVYIADSGFGNARIRKVSPSGVITTIAGNGQDGYSGDGGPATRAQISPVGVAVDNAGDVFIAGAHAIRKISRTGIITTVAGSGSIGYTGDGGPAKTALFNYTSDIAIDSAGNLYIADTRNHRIRKVFTNGRISSIWGEDAPDWPAVAVPRRRN